MGFQIEMRNILYNMAIETENNWLEIYDLLQNRHMPKDMVVVPTKVITIIDEDYPEFMKGYYKPAFILIKEGKKWYVPYGKGLKKRFEVKADAEKQYIKNLNKYC